MQFSHEKAHNHVDGSPVAYAGGKKESQKATSCMITAITFWKRQNERTRE